MNKRIKRAMMAGQRRRKDGTYMNYGPYDERSGSFGIAPDGTSYPVYPEMRRNRNSKGQFTASYPMSPYIPPIYEHSEEMDPPRNRIGFAMPEEWNAGRYGMTANMESMDEMTHRTGKRTQGYAKGMDEPMTHEMAMRWVKGMKNADGSTGPHWTMEQARQVMEQQKIQCDEVEFFVALNMMYSDYCKVAKKFNVEVAEFYACMAKAFLDDKDAQPDKLERYYEYIAKH